MEKVIVTVVGSQTDALGEENRIELVSIGKHYHRNGTNYILYEDGDISGMERTSTLLKIGGDSVTLVRRGDVTQEQYFAESVQSESVYATPYGKMKLSVLTHKLDICYASVSGSVDIFYALSVDGRWQSDNRLRIDICAEQTDNSHLN